MAAIEFLITANYKEVDAAIKKIEELKATLKGIKANDPAAQELIDQIKRQQEEYDKLVENIRQLKEEQAKQVQDAINENKKQEQEIERLAKAYKDLYEQMNKEASKPKKTESVIPPSAAQAQAGAEVKDQADAYQDLNKYITEVNGSLNNNIVRLLSEKQALATVKKELSELSKEEKASGKVTEENRKRKIELTQAEFEYKQSISQLEKTIKTDIKLNQAAEGSMSRLSLSLQRMKSLLRNEGSLDKTFVSALEKEIKLVDSRLKEFEKSMGEYNRNVGNYPDLFKELSSSLSGISEATSLLPGPLGRATSSMHGLTAASLRFLATPLGVILAAIAAALATVASWFKRTQEGEEALNITSAYFKQTLESILDVVDNVGEWLYKAFTKPKDAAKDLVDFLEGQVMNRLNALGVMGESVMKIFSGDFSGGLKGIADAVAQAVTGIEKPINEASKFADDVIEKANKRAALADRENKLTREQTKWLVERSELEARINELRERSQDGSLSENERLKASQKASQLINQLYQKEISLAEEKRDIISETNKLSHSNTEALQKEAQAQADVNKAVAERYAKNRELLSQQKELTNKIGAYATESAKRIKEIAENEKKIEEKEREAELAIEEAKINAMQEGYEKQEALIQLNYKKRILSVSKMGEELLKIQQENERKMWESENPDASRRGLIFTPKTQSVSQLPVGMLKILTDTMNAIDIETEKKEADILKKTLDKYKDYSTQRVEIEKNYNQDVAYLESKRNSENSKLIDAALIEAEKKRKESLSRINLTEFQEEINWNTVFSDFDKVSTASLLSLRDKLKSFLSEVGSSLSKEDMKVVMDAFEKMNTEIADRTPIDRLVSSYKDYKESAEEVKKAQEELNKAEAKGGKSSKEYKDALDKLTNAQNSYRSSLKNMTDAVNSIGDKGQQVVEAGNNIVDMLTDIGISVPESITNVLEGIGQVASSLASIDLTKPFSVITGVTGVIGGLGKAIGSLFNRDNKREKNIQKLQKQVETLQKSYENLGKSIERAYSTDASDFIDQQNKMLEQQKLIIQNQIKEEQSKKHTDNDRIKEWRDQIDEINQTLEDNKEKQVDAIFGSDVQTAIDDFAQAYVDAWAAGEDKATSMKDVVKKMIRGIVVEMIKADFSGTIENLRNKIKDMLVDGVIDQYEENQINKIIEQISSDADKKYSWADRFIKEQKEEEDASKRSASAKGIESISQDSANIIEGKLTAGLIYLDKTSIAVTDIASQMKIISKQSYEGWKNVETILDVVESIERLNTRVTDNTDDIKSIVSGIKENTRKISNDTDSINRNGVDIRR